ncbi:MAG: peptidoglycan recognition family protein [Pyrinomonadaceae bacterium]
MFLRCLLLLGSTTILLLCVTAVSYENTIDPGGIIIHHSVVTTTPFSTPVDLKTLESSHGRRGFSIFYWGHFYRIGYHYLIFPDGTVVAGRPERCRGAHAVGHNSDLGICLIGDFSSHEASQSDPDSHRPTEAQMRALLELCRRLCARYHIPVERVQRHRDVNDRTECPGDNFPFQEFINELKNSSRDDS